MKVLLTGHTGYVGSVMAPMLEADGHEVFGLDTGFFEHCLFGQAPAPVAGRSADLRDLGPTDVRGFDAVIHLAGLSNDPLGNVNPELTYAINHRASVLLAELARAEGVGRFLFASSCSLYGVQGEGMLDETAAFNPITPYGESKILVEQDVSQLATDSFSPVFLRNATAYGVSPRLRADIVVNNLVGHAFTTGDVLIQSDGTPWRPLVHVQDFCRAFLSVLTAPRDVVHNQAFNVGRTEENYRVSEVADMVQAAVPGSTVRYAPAGAPDPRSYRVSCEKLESSVPGYKPTWTVELGIRELADAYQEAGLTADEFFGNDYFRLREIRRLQDEGRLDDDLYWQNNEGEGAS